MGRPWLVRCELLVSKWRKSFKVANLRKNLEFGLEAQFARHG
uniref:Uncharacterized protein n=1 Tax=viral metagenome TaxID=1070528 RepID=A0A6C0F585_9ZZZZ